MKTPRIYLDHINGSPLLPQVQAAMAQACLQFGNPSSLHAAGRFAAQARDVARAKVAGLIGAHPQEIIFTSSGTEANLLALIGLAKAHESKGKHLVVSAVEHLSILQTVRRMEKEGWKVTLLPVDSKGHVFPEILEKALTPETVLVSIQWANAEVGTLQRMEKLVPLVTQRGILFHTDAVAAAGQVPIDVKEIPVDALTLAANTFGGPAGVGALFVRHGVRLLPLMVGGSQEEGRRAGTENLIGIVGMGEAAATRAGRLSDIARQLTPLRERLIQGILTTYLPARLNGDLKDRLPGHASVSFPGADAEALVLRLDLKGVCVGIGSACSSRAMKASHVLKAMGVEDSRALGTITVTLGEQTAEEEIQAFLNILFQQLEREGQPDDLESRRRKINGSQRTADSGAARG